ncbi:MAG TPA: carboxypeptidase-like regulatory domain-containing protein [Bryobacteraceae bacterium]|nr:carboxypeptidase-like regulatory domain-containing protein [Bryobacteraceae bacterium]
MLLRILTFLCAVFAAAHAQEVTASIAGRVLDTTGAVIPGVKITVKNVDTHQTLTVTSEPTGNFLAPLLRPGRYSLTAVMEGFRTFEQSGIVLEIGQRASLNIPLQIGQVEERISVTAELATINTENSTVGKVIDSRSISQIPLNGRLNIVGLMALAPGIQNAGNQDGLPTFGITPTVAGGSNTGSVAFSLDGVTNQLAWIERGFGEWPPLDGLQEFRVITSSATAEFGKANQIIAITRGGTNEIHGTLLAFNRNRFLAAKNFFATGLPLPQFNRNEFGGNFSGPVFLPKLYSGKDRTFFFFNYEGFRRRQASTRSTQVATPKMRSGDFSEFRSITDPLTGAPFPDNIIPQSRLNPVTQRLGQLWPLPNLPGTGVNLIENIPLPEDVDRTSFRIDHKLSSKDQLSGTMMLGYLGPNPSIGSVSTFGGFAQIGEHNTNSSLNLNHMFSPSVLSETRLGYMHVRIYRTPQNFRFDPSTVIPGLPVPEYFGGAPQISIQNIVGMSEAGSGDLDQETWIRACSLWKMCRW